MPLTRASLISALFRGAVASLFVRYVVTGGAGFIGSNHVRGLLDGRWGTDVESVTVLDAFTYAGNRDNLRSVAGDARLTVVEGDIRNDWLLAEHLPGHDVVVHFAAESHVDRSIGSGSVFVSTNVLGTQCLLDASRRAGVHVFVHVSTDEVYGSIDEGSWDEEQPLAPTSPYAASKAGSDLLVLAGHRTHGMDVRVTRCSNNFGTHQQPEKLIPLFITNLLEGLDVPVYGDGLNRRNWLHVDDHCRAIELVVAGGRPGEVYNIGGGTELSNLDLTHLVLELLGENESRIRHVEDRPGHDRRYSVDWSKIADELGYTPLLPLADSLPAVVDWYRGNPDWWRPLKHGGR
jgi:dTDP-glucose 4,6-dehydratase